MMSVAIQVPARHPAKGNCACAQRRNWCCAQWTTSRHHLGLGQDGGVQWTTAIFMVRITDKPMEFLVYRQMNGALGQVIIWVTFLDPPNLWCSFLMWIHPFSGRWYLWPIRNLWVVWHGPWCLMGKQPWPQQEWCWLCRRTVNESPQSDYEFAQFLKDT